MIKKCYVKCLHKYRHIIGRFLWGDFVMTDICLEINMTAIDLIAVIITVIFINAATINVYARLASQDLQVHPDPQGLQVQPDPLD